MSSTESKETKEDRDAWKDEEVENWVDPRGRSQGTYRELVDQVVKAHDDLKDAHNPYGGDRRGGTIQRAAEAAERLHDLAHAHEKKMIQQNRLTEIQRKKGQWHHKPQWWNFLGNRKIHNPRDDTKAKPLHLRGGKKKRKTKRKKTKRKKRKTKRRKKTRKHKRRKRRKTRKR